MTSNIDIQEEAGARGVAACYEAWGTEYYNEHYGPHAPYPPVHLALIREVLERSGARRVLDAGCGPASVMRHLAQWGFDLHGFDLTAAMVREARRVLAEHGIEADRVWEGSVIDPGAFDRGRTTDRNRNGYDAVLCIGVLPHVEELDEATVLANLRDALRPGGVVILEARNQLFSLFTANRYSHEFVTRELIQLDQLLDAAGEDASAVSGAVSAMQDMVRMDLPPIRPGANGAPGYDQVLSRRHNPLVLREQVTQAGFADVEVLFYHYHCLPPMFERDAPALFRARSLAMEHPRDWRGHFMASAFLVTGRRT